MGISGDIKMEHWAKMGYDVEILKPFHQLRK